MADPVPDEGLFEASFPVYTIVDVAAYREKGLGPSVVVLRSPEIGPYVPVFTDDDLAERAIEDLGGAGMGTVVLATPAALRYLLTGYANKGRVQHVGIDVEPGPAPVAGSTPSERSSTPSRLTPPDPNDPRARLDLAGLPHTPHEGGPVERVAADADSPLWVEPGTHPGAAPDAPWRLLSPPVVEAVGEYAAALREWDEAAEAQQAKEHAAAEGRQRCTAAKRAADEARERLNGVLLGIPAEHVRPITWPADTPILTEPRSRPAP